MADLGENIRSVIVGSTAVLAEFPGAAAPYAVLQNVEPENPPLPRIFYSRSSGEQDLFLDGDAGLTNETWDIEIISDSVDEAQDIAAAVKTLLHGKRGTFGTQTVQGVFITDHNDDYVPKSPAADEGYCVAALSATIWL